ncbi:hypothetical protein BJX66DRAFT_310121 [Aspergillus keveii]|uniref:Uncharacterized protein n=1 Tax=Aspergillus keveii TaxID=714993 RepID=A0ABR4FXT3_9EURO
MQFSKILTTAFLAVAATAAPAPQTYSVDFGAIQSFTSNLQTICSQIQGNLANAAGEFNYVISGYQGDASQSLQQLWGQVEAGNGQIQQACASIISALNAGTESYQQAESDNAAAFANAIARTG